VGGILTHLGLSLLPNRPALLSVSWASRLSTRPAMPPTRIIPRFWRSPAPAALSAASGGRLCPCC